jgi:hypothetical protein
MREGHQTTNGGLMAATIQLEREGSTPPGLRPPQPTSGEIVTQSNQVARA